MSKENRVEADEQRRIEQHAQIKGEIRDEVHQELEQEAQTSHVGDRAAVRSSAQGLKQRAIEEVSQGEHELDSARRATRISQVVDYGFYVVYSLIGLQIALELLGAREWAGFKKFMNFVTWPFLEPFKGLMPDPAVGSMQLMLSYVVALVVYFLLHKGITRALGLFVGRTSSG